jgi:predicted nuclease of predicted toxin-antitoxin system
MKIKLDENLPAELRDLLRLAGHDVHTVPSEQLAGRDDQTIFQAAAVEGRMLITQDLDFSDVRLFRPGTHPGVVLVRLHSPSRQSLIARVRQVLQTESFDSFAGCLVVISDNRLRIRHPAT